MMERIKRALFGSNGEVHGHVAEASASAKATSIAARELTRELTEIQAQEDPLAALVYRVKRSQGQ
jgi:hypothetical protein